MATTDRGVGQRVEDAKEGMNMTTMMTKADRLMKTLCAAVVMVLAVTAASAADLDSWRAGTVVSAQEVTRYGVDRCFAIEQISDAVFARMRYSYMPNPHIARADLRYLRLLHRDAHDRIVLGEMVCHRSIAADLVAIFRQLYDAHYPIARMVLVDEYRADDETSMRANNTSCFCYRTVAGSRKVSAHAMGMAVDINPLYNPYVKRRANGRLFIQPANAEPYTHRERRFDYKIERGDLCHRLFLQHGFSWGGAWRSLKDYQHFEKPF